jgi:hypothetical protein
MKSISPGLRLPRRSMAKTGATLGQRPTK